MKSQKINNEKPYYRIIISEKPLKMKMKEK
jgi:hypothetical protein